MNTSFFDTETTGLKIDRYPDTHPKQPMPIQIGIKVDDERRNERCAANYMIVPQGWVMGAKAMEITGLSNDLADEFGTDLITGYEFFRDMIANSGVVVAHNINFDKTVMRRCAQVYSELTAYPYEDPFEDRTMICTMLASMDIVKALPKRNGKYKWPKLTEAVKYFFNEDLDGAHDALIDVRGCSRVYYELLDGGVFHGQEYKFA